MDCSPPGSSVYGRILCPSKNTGVGCHFHLQGILTQGWNPGLLHWQADSLLLSHLGSPRSLLVARRLLKSLVTLQGAGHLINMGRVRTVEQMEFLTRDSTFCKWFVVSSVHLYFVLSWVQTKLKTSWAVFVTVLRCLYFSEYDFKMLIISKYKEDCHHIEEIRHMTEILVPIWMLGAL